MKQYVLLMHQKYSVNIWKCKSDPISWPFETLLLINWIYFKYKIRTILKVQFKYYISSLYKFGSCPFCPSNTFSVHYVFICMHRIAKWSPNFTKPTAYVMFGLPSCFKLFETVPFCYFFLSVFVILKHFLPENEKKQRPPSS